MEKSLLFKLFFCFNKVRFWFICPTLYCICICYLTCSLNINYCLIDIKNLEVDAVLYYLGEEKCVCVK